MSCNLGDESVILNLKDSIYYGLDDVGNLVWGLIQERRSIAEIRDAILAEYDVAADRCEHDLYRLLGQMAERGLVEIHDESAI